MRCKDTQTITKVRKDGKWYEITMDDGLSISVEAKYKVVPKKGDKITITSRGGKFTEVIGMAINDVVLYEYTDEEVAKHDQERREKWKKELWESHRKALKESKGDPPFETIDISGMSGGYEMTCQRMLYAGIQFLKAHPHVKLGYKSYENIYGLATSDTPAGKALDKVLMKAAKDDCTGAMHQAVVGHLTYIHLHGYEEWLKQFPAERRYKYPTELPEPKED